MNFAMPKTRVTMCSTVRERSSCALKYQEVYLEQVCPPLIHVAIELTLVPVNLGVLRTLGYFTYRHWDSPNLTKKNATIGLITWFSGQGYFVEKCRQDHLGKRDDYARMKGGVEEGYGKVKGGTKALESEFEKGLKSVEDEFGPLGGVRRKSEAERVDIAVGRLEKKKEGHACILRESVVQIIDPDECTMLSFCYHSLF
jgi:hypothetical protein